MWESRERNLLGFRRDFTREEVLREGFKDENFEGGAENMPVCSYLSPVKQGKLMTTQILSSHLFRGRTLAFSESCVIHSSSAAGSPCFQGPAQHLAYSWYQYVFARLNCRDPDE